MVVHPLSHGVPRAPRYSGFSQLLSAFGYGALTPFGRPSHAVPLACRRFPLSLPRPLRATRFTSVNRYQLIDIRYVVSATRTFLIFALRAIPPICYLLSVICYLPLRVPRNGRFGLLRVRSPLLAESRLISFPRPT